MIVDEGCFERGCACHDSRESPGVVVVKREWRGLKEWEINDGLDQIPSEDVCSWSFRKGVYFAEAALKERNL